MIKTLSHTSWLVEIQDTLHPNSDPSFPRLIQVVVLWKDGQFHFLPWRVIQTIPLRDGTDHVVTAGLPDSPYTWDLVVPMATYEFFRNLTAGNRTLYKPKEGV